MHSVTTVHKSHSYINIPSRTAVLTKCFRRKSRPELLPYGILTITICTQKVKTYPQTSIVYTITQENFTNQASIAQINLPSTGSKAAPYQWFSRVAV